jgi:hypothetical protein
MRLLTLVPLMAIALVACNGSLAASPTSDDRVRATVDERVSAWWPTPDEKRFDQIGWAPDIRTARKLAAERDRPVFLFTMDGRVNIGRC